MEHTLPDIILFPIPFVCLFAYLKEVELYITMFKKHPKLLTGIIIGCLVILVVVIVCNANWVITNCTDASTGGQSDFNAFEGINALFAGLAFIGILYTLHQQNKQLKENVKQQEVDNIIQSILILQTTLTNINMPYKSGNIKSEANSEKILFYFSEQLGEEIKLSFNKLIRGSNEENKDKAWEKFAYIYKGIEQRFLEIAYPLGAIYEHIEKSPNLTSNEKERLGRQAFSILSPSDVKLLSIIFTAEMFNEILSSYKTFNKYFSKRGNKIFIAGLTSGDEELTNTFIYIIKNSTKLANKYKSLHIESAGN